MKKILLPILGAIVLCLNLSVAQETKLNSSRHAGHDGHAGHAPIGIMGDHYHKKGGLMFSYRYMMMNMKGLRQGANEIVKEDVLKSYQMSPEQMSMGMHMFGVMYALSDNITLMGMANYSSVLMETIWMQHNSDLTTPAMFRTFNSDGKSEMANGDTKNSGFSDTKVGALIKLFNKDSQSLHINSMIIIPTGSITEMGTSMSKTLRSGYPMQLGAGSWGADLGFTYVVQGEVLLGGVQPIFTTYFGANQEGYKVGNKSAMSGWLAAKINDWVSLSGVLKYEIQAKNSESDTVLEKQKLLMFEKAGKRYMMPGFVSDFSGGEFLNAGLGVNIYVPKGFLKGTRFGVQYSLPVYQNVNGIQMSIENRLTLGLQYSLGGHHHSQDD